MVTTKGASLCFASVRLGWIFFLLPACGAFHTVEKGALPSQRDYRKFHTRTVANEGPVFRFYEGNQPDLGKRIILESKAFDPENVSLDSFINTHKTIAFLIIRNDSLLYEKYLDGYSETSIYSSFSIAKAFVGALVGIAIDEGKIHSEQDPVTDYLPELKRINGFDKIKIKHLLQHTSGIKFTDSELDLGSDNARFYWGNELRKEIQNLKLECPPGTYFHYGSANTQLLGMVLEKVYSTSISEILQEKIWKPLGMESPALWATDRNDSLAVEKAFCCLYARAIDFAKFGKLYLDHGRWNNHQIVPEAWVMQSVNPDYSGHNRRYYNNNLGLSPLNYHSFYAIGLFGQYIYCDPDKNLIIVRFGNPEVILNSSYWSMVFMQLSDQL